MAELKIDFNTLEWGKLADAMKSVRTGKQPYWKCDDDSEIPEAHFHYEHASKPIAKITRAPHISCDDVVMPHYGESFDNLNKEFLVKNFNIKEDKHMNGYAQQLACRKAEEKLQKLYDEKGSLTREDIWNAMGVRVVDARNYRKQVVMSNRDGKGLSVEARAAIEAIDDQVYLPYKLPFGLEPLTMWQTDNGYTTVAWADGTTTSAKIENGGRATPYGGFCACVVKKLYGSTGQAIKMMEHADKNAKWPAEKKRIEREKLKKIHQANAEMRREKEAKRREHLIEMHMEEIYAQREAERRVAEADEKKGYEP